jgi:hypothetical protein
VELLTKVADHAEKQGHEVPCTLIAAKRDSGDTVLAESVRVSRFFCKTLLTCWLFAQPPKPLVWSLTHDPNPALIYNSKCPSFKVSLTRGGNLDEQESETRVFGLSSGRQASPPARVEGCGQVKVGFAGPAEGKVKRVSTQPKRQVAGKGGAWGGLEAECRQ